MSLPLERLQNAVESGDVLELENAIAAAQDTLFSLENSSRPPAALQALLSEAKTVFLDNLERCKHLLKPLRRACRQLDEAKILAALLQTEEAPDTVQLCMYTDIQKAEALREDIIAAQNASLEVLGSEDWRVVDEFLMENTPVLENRTVLALVQKREELLRRTTRDKPHLAGRAASLPRAPSRTSRSTSARRAIRSLPHQSSLPLSQNDYLIRAEDGQNSADEQAIGGVARQLTHLRPPPSLGVISETRYLSKAGGTGTSPWIQQMRLLRDRESHALAQDEAAAREALTRSEFALRVHLYESEMRAQVQVLCPGVNGSGNETFLAWGHPERSEVQSPGESKHASSPGGSPAPLTEVPRHARSRTRAPLQSAPSTGRSLSAGTRRDGSSDGLTAAHSSAGVDRPTQEPKEEAGRRLVVGGQHSLRAATPNISPIRTTLSTSLFSPREAHGASPESTVLRPAPTPVQPLRAAVPVMARAMEETSAYSGANQDAEPFSTAEKRASSVASTAGVTALDQHRLQARLRGLLREEDIGRRDVEGTENFDRSVFLFPISARLSMWNANQADRLTALAEY